jgi:integrase
MATFQERISDIGKTSYRVQVRLKGFPTQTATFERKTDAKKWAQATEAAIREGRHFKTTEAKKHTLAELIDRYIKDVLPLKPKSLNKQRAQLLWWRKQIGSFSLAELTPSLIAEQRDLLLSQITNRGGKRTPATTNRYLAALSHTFTIGLKEWGWLERNPMQKITKPKEPRGRIRFLSNEERSALLEACKNSTYAGLYLIVVLCLSTGARKMEVVGLRWQDIDLTRQVIILHETKNGERRVLPLSGLALELLIQRSHVRQLYTDFIFPAHNLKTPMDIRAPWDRAITHANLKDFRFHDLRHSAASYLAMNGATLSEIADILGHKTLQMVKRYAHLSEAHTATVVAKMNERIFG